MQTNDFDGAIEADVQAVKPPAAFLRLVAVHASPVPQRRRAPRRQLVMSVAVERRGDDRRKRKPGIDGLLRMVLSDSWR